MKFKTLIYLSVLLFNCTDKSVTANESTNFNADTLIYEIRQIYNMPNSDDFVVVYFKESSMSFGSGNKLVKLYNKDSISIDERFYAAHPLEIVDYYDSILTVKVSVIGSHGDSTYRKWYLDNSVDKNKSIGKYQIEYLKNYNF